MPFLWRPLEDSHLCFIFRALARLHQLMLVSAQVSGSFRRLLRAPTAVFMVVTSYPPCMKHNSGRLFTPTLWLLWGTFICSYDSRWLCYECHQVGVFHNWKIHAHRHGSINKTALCEREDVACSVRRFERSISPKEIVMYAVHLQARIVGVDWLCDNRRELSEATPLPCVRARRIKM